MIGKRAYASALGAACWAMVACGGGVKTHFDGKAKSNTTAGGVIGGSSAGDGSGTGSGGASANGSSSGGSTGSTGSIGLGSYLGDLSLPGQGLKMPLSGDTTGGSTSTSGGSASTSSTTTSSATSSTNSGATSTSSGGASTTTSGGGTTTSSTSTSSGATTSSTTTSSSSTSGATSSGGSTGSTGTTSRGGSTGASSGGSTGNSCTPDTCASLGMSCGSVSDGCGGTLVCGSCTAGDSCGAGTANVCGCVPTTCAAAGAQCGLIPDGCGGVLDCGQGCTGSDTCGGGGPNLCGPGACTPDLSCSGSQCGVRSDGCGGVTDCGGCSGTDSCGGGGTPNVCGCTALTCAELGATCGSVPDGCGGTLDCGSCSGADSCGGGGFDVCGPNSCTPVTCASQGKDCGDISDGCGNILHCGGCTAPESCGGGGTANVCGCADGCATVSSLSVTPADSIIPANGSEQLTAIASFSNGAARDATSVASWDTSDPALFTVAAGLVTAAGDGSGTASATWSGASGTANVTVVPFLVSVDVAPGSASIAAGGSQDFTATGTFSDGSQQDLTSEATWSSSDPGAASVSGGVATGLFAGGTTTITASYAGLSGSATLTVSAATLTAISITPSNPTIAKGTTIQFTATAIYSDQTFIDVTNSVTWSTSTPANASMVGPGLFQGISNGTSTIGAVDPASGLSDSTLLTVTNAVLTEIEVFPATPQIAFGTQIQFTATGVFSDLSTQDLTSQVTWSSSDTGIATIQTGGATPGRALGIAAGTTTITAAANGFSGSTTLTVTDATLVSIDVTPVDPRIANLTDVQLTATGNFSDGTTQDLTWQVSWSSSDPGIADASNALGSEGLVTAYSPGTVTVSATELGVTGATTVTVTAATLVSIAIDPASVGLPIQSQMQFHAIGTFSDGTTQDITRVVAWSSDQKTVATVSNAVGSQGLVTSNGQGTAHITARRQALTATSTVTVANYKIIGVVVVPDAATLAANQTLQLQAIGTYDDMNGGTFTLDVTNQVHWASRYKDQAVVSTSGLVKALAPTAAGSPDDISAWKLNQTGDCMVTVQ